MDISLWFHVTCIPVVLGIAFLLGWITGRFAPNKDCHKNLPMNKCERNEQDGYCGRCHSDSYP